LQKTCARDKKTTSGCWGEKIENRLEKPPSFCQAEPPGQKKKEPARALTIARRKKKRGHKKALDPLSKKRRGGGAAVRWRTRRWLRCRRPRKKKGIGVFFGGICVQSRPEKKKKKRGGSPPSPAPVTEGEKEARCQSAAREKKGSCPLSTRKKQKGPLKQGRGSFLITRKEKKREDNLFYVPCHPQGKGKKRKEEGRASCPLFSL